MITVYTAGIFWDDGSAENGVRMSLHPFNRTTAFGCLPDGDRRFVHPVMFRQGPAPWWISCFCTSRIRKLYVDVVYDLVLLGSSLSDADAIDVLVEMERRR
jgi:hypothetical protein